MFKAIIKWTKGDYLKNDIHAYNINGRILILGKTVKETTEEQFIKLIDIELKTLREALIAYRRKLLTEGPVIFRGGNGLSDISLNKV